MNARIQELLDYLEQERRDLDAAIATVPAERHNEKLGPDSWCVAEVVQHLAITDRRITALLAKLVDEALAAGATPDTSSDPILSTIKVSHLLDRTKKIRNPKGDPPGDRSTSDGLKALDEARDGMRALLTRPDLPNLSLVSAPNPAFGPMNGYEWVAFVSAHTRRHADQIREVGQQLALTGRGCGRRRRAIRSTSTVRETKLKWPPKAGNSVNLFVH